MEVKIDKSIPTHFNNFSDYWKHICYYESLERKWLPWRLKHKDNWKTMNNKILWLNLLFLSSPLFPKKLAYYISYRLCKKAQQKVEKSMVDYISDTINKEILESLKKTMFDENTGEMRIKQDYM